MKQIKFLSMLIAVVAMSVCFTGCSSDDDEITDIATVISGDYSGKLTIMGLADQFTTYVTLTRKSDVAVAVVIDCDELDMHLQSVILDITESNGSYELSSTSKAVNGSVIGKSLNLTFSVGSYTCTFYGNK